jgi:hypothetical protein
MPGLFLSLRWIEFQRGSVDTAAQAGRSRTIAKHMSKMGIAHRAAHLGSAEEYETVIVLARRVAVDWRMNARSARTGIAFCPRREQLCTATDTTIQTGRPFVPIWATERALCAVRAGDSKLFKCKDFSPFLGAFDRFQIGSEREIHAGACLKNAESSKYINDKKQVTAARTRTLGCRKAAA